MFSNLSKKYIPMKKYFCVSTILLFTILSLKGQTVTNYTYLLDNGINVKTEHCWSHVWVQQNYEAIKDGTQAAPLAVTTRTLGDLILPGSTIKLLSGGKEVKMQNAAPGTYELKVSSKLSGRPGTLSFIAPNIVIKPKTKTSVSLILYDYQISITETPGTLNGLSSYESTVNCFKGSPGQNPHKLTVTFYPKGNRAAKITPDETTSDLKGKIKPGTYDVLLSIAIATQKHEVWLENFILKPDVSYKIGTNLNSGIIIYTGGNKEVKTMHLYPAGTAAKQTDKPAPDKTREIISYDNITAPNACAPNVYEWTKGINVQTGIRSEVK
jgi:hypothetical protein